jgi:hypothetical protein
MEALELKEIVGNKIFFCSFAVKVTNLRRG